LGMLLGQRGQLQEAAVLLEQAIAGKPDFADAHAALGNVYWLRENQPEAAASYREAIRLEPRNAAVHSNLGLIYQRDCQHEAALRCFMRAHELAPEFPVALKHLTQEWIALEQFEQALVVLQELYRKQPDRFDVLTCLVAVLHAMHRPAEALDYGRKARALNGNDVELLTALGIVLRDLGRLDEALESFAAALALQPDSVVALWHRSLVYLLQHDFARGWLNYDLRLASADLVRRPNQYPAWNGIADTERRILIYGEQGLGDEIMFASCLPEMIAASGHCVVECSARLESLFRRSFPAATVYAALPDKSVPQRIRDLGIDVQIAMGSIPRYRRNRPLDFPLHHGYLVADPERVVHWRRQLETLGSGLKVGISWQGGSNQSRRPVRSIPLAHWVPILRIPRAHFVDLQYSDCVDEVNELESNSGIHIHRWEAVRNDYEETAAMVGALDCVISVCTAVVHLGGALGKPVWVLAPYSPEWRYGIAGEKMTWYPSVTVFRQPRYGEWEPVVARVVEELRRRTNVPGQEED
jgi:tetratricopeptide (TPR) repeat protein